MGPGGAAVESQRGPPAEMFRKTEAGARLCQWLESISAARGMIQWPGRQRHRNTHRLLIQDDDFHAASLFLGQFLSRKRTVCPPQA